MFAGLVSPDTVVLQSAQSAASRCQPAARNILQFANICRAPATQQEQDNTWFGPQDVQISLRLINWLSLQNVESAKLQQSPTVQTLPREIFTVSDNV